MLQASITEANKMFLSLGGSAGRSKYVNNRDV